MSPNEGTVTEERTYVIPGENTVLGAYEALAKCPNGWIPRVIRHERGKWIIVVKFHPMPLSEMRRL